VERLPPTDNVDTMAITGRIRGRGQIGEALADLVHEEARPVP